MERELLSVIYFALSVGSCVFIPNFSLYHEKDVIKCAPEFTCLPGRHGFAKKASGSVSVVMRTERDYISYHKTHLISRRPLSSDIRDK